MAPSISDAGVLERLRTLGVVLLSEWDTLVFLYNHAASLNTAAQIARLIGYDNSEVGAAMHRLESLGLIQRSRDSQGVRLYRYTEHQEISRQSCLEELAKHI